MMCVRIRMYVSITLRNVAVTSRRNVACDITQECRETMMRIRTLIMESLDSIIESVDSISRDERGFPLTQYITNGRISRTR